MPPRLRPVPDAPLRALGLIRVSHEREEMISPELQETAIEDHCARRGYALQRPLIVGLDESGSRRKSPWWAQLDRAVAAVESGDADVLVVWRFSRAARQRLRWAVAIDRVEVAGGLLESATEPLDTSTASGRLARGMLAEMAAYEAEVIGNTWRETHARRTKAGLPANGKPRFGYRVVDGLHRPQPPESDVLAALYRRYVAGESLLSLVRWLNAGGVQTVAGYSKAGPGAWSQTSLRRCLDSGFGAGQIRVHGERRPGAHEPVIDAATWDAYLAARTARRPLRRAESSRYLLSGLMRCGFVLASGTVCGSGMGGGAFGHAGTKPGFRCTRAATSGTHHPHVWWMAPLEQQVRDWLAELAGEVTTRADAAAAQASRVARRQVDAKAAEREALQVDRTLAQLAVNQANPAMTMPQSVFDAARAQLLAQRTAAEDRARQARADATVREPGQVAANLLAEWPALSVEIRRGVLRGLIRHIIATRGEKPRIVPEFDG